MLESGRRPPARKFPRHIGRFQRGKAAADLVRSTVEGSDGGCVHHWLPRAGHRLLGEQAVWNPQAVLLYRLSPEHERWLAIGDVDTGHLGLLQAVMSNYHSTGRF